MEPEPDQLLLLVMLDPKLLLLLVIEAPPTLLLLLTYEAPYEPAE